MSNEPINSETILNLRAQARTATREGFLAVGGAVAGATFLAIDAYNGQMLDDNTGRAGAALLSLGAIVAYSCFSERNKQNQIADFEEILSHSDHSGN